MFAVVHGRAVAIAPQGLHGSRGNLFRRERGRWIVHHAHGRSCGKFRQAHPRHPPPRKHSLGIVGAGVDNRAIPQIDPHMGVFESRSGQLSLDREPVAACHLRSAPVWGGGRGAGHAHWKSLRGGAARGSRRRVGWRWKCGWKGLSWPGRPGFAGGSISDPEGRSRPRSPGRR